MELEVEMAHLKFENYKLLLMVSHQSDQMRELKKKFSDEVQMLKAENLRLVGEAEKKERQHQEEVKQLKERHSKELWALDAVDNMSLVMEQQKCKDFELKIKCMECLSDIDKMKIRNLELKTSCIEQLNSVMKDEIRSMENKMSQLSTDYNRLKEAHDNLLSAKDSLDIGIKTPGKQMQPQDGFIMVKEEIISHYETNTVEEAIFWIDLNIKVPQKQVASQEILDLKDLPRNRKRQEGSEAMRAMWEGGRLVDRNKITGNRERRTPQTPNAPERPHTSLRTWV